MLDLHVAPLVGALIISNDAWNKISAEDRAKMTEAAGRDGNAHPRRSAEAGRRLGHGDEGARPRR